MLCTLGCGRTIPKSEDNDAPQEKKGRRKLYCSNCITFCCLIKGDRSMTTNRKYQYFRSYSRSRSGSGSWAWSRSRSGLGLSRGLGLDLSCGLGLGKSEGK